MYFGTTAFKTAPATVSDPYCIESVVYNEYLNRKSMLEVCTDESQKTILEAQVEVLCEASIKDLWAKVKEAFVKLKRWIKNLWDNIFNKYKKRRKELDEYFHKDMEKMKDDMSENIDKAFGHDDVNEKFREYINNFVESCKLFRYSCNGKEQRIGNMHFYAFDVSQSAKSLSGYIKYINTYSSDKDIEEMKEDIKEIKELNESINNIVIEEYPASEEVGGASMFSNKEKVCSRLIDVYSHLIKNLALDYDSVMKCKKDIDICISGIEEVIGSKQKLMDDYEKLRDKATDQEKRMEKFRENMGHVNTAMQELKNLNTIVFKLSEKVNSISAKIDAEVNKVEAFMAKDFEYDLDKAAEEKEQKKQRRKAEREAQEKEENEKKEEE